MADPVTLTLSVTYFGILLGLGILVANLLKKAKVPDTFFLLLLGLVLGPTVYANPIVTRFVSTTLVDLSVAGNIPDFLRILALIMVVFTSMFNLGMRAFKRVGNSALNIALVGVTFNTIVMGFVLNLVFGIDIMYAFVITSVISGTGTGVLFVYDRLLKGSRRALNIVKVESILNTPLSVLFPILFLELITLQSDVIQPMLYLRKFWIMVALGAGAGLIMGLAVTKVFRSLLKEYTPLMLFSFALISYSLAENVGGSGMLAVAVAGLLAGTYISRGEDEVRVFDDHLSEMLRISVFTLLGAQITLAFTPMEFISIVSFFIIMTFARPIFLYPALGKKKMHYDRDDFFLMSFLAPRGLGSAAMAPIVATAFIAIGQEALAAQMMNIVFMVILLSVAVSTAAGIYVSRKPSRNTTERKAPSRSEMRQASPVSLPQSA
jgi:cell volume regulation protein A